MAHGRFQRLQAEARVERIRQFLRQLSRPFTPYPVASTSRYSEGNGSV